MRRTIHLSDGNIEAKIEPSADVASALWATITTEGRVDLDSARTLMELVCFVSAASYPLGVKVQLDCVLEPDSNVEGRRT